MGRKNIYDNANEFNTTIVQLLIIDRLLLDILKLSIIPYNKEFFKTGCKKFLFVQQTKSTALKYLLTIAQQLLGVVYRRFSEKWFINKYMNTVNSSSLMDIFQSVFRTSHGAKSSLVKLFQDIQKEMENNIFPILIMFDLTTAFDRVSRTRLLKKL